MNNNGQKNIADPVIIPIIFILFFVMLSGIISHNNEIQSLKSCLNFANDYDVYIEENICYVNINDVNTSVDFIFAKWGPVWREKYEYIQPKKYINIFGAELCLNCIN
jgi:hypothetical protein